MDTILTVNLEFLLKDIFLGHVYIFVVFQSRRRQSYQVFLLAEERRFDTKKCQIVPKNATRHYIENRTFGDQITSPVILPTESQLKWRRLNFSGKTGIFL